jgi:class 3 adenylate cyclase
MARSRSRCAISALSTRIWATDPRTIAANTTGAIGFALVGDGDVLFTDIKASTPRWETDAEAMAVDLAARDEVLRAAIGGHRGAVFKHTGDGVCAAFGSASDAMAAAVEAQRRLRLPVRVGIATGTAELRDADYFGPALNRAAG